MLPASRHLSEEVAKYEQACEMWASKYVGWNMAELDDLVQEGLIAVWLAIDADVHPSKQVVVGRMHNYVRALGRQIGQSSGDEDSYVPIDVAAYEDGLSAAAYEDWFHDEFQE